MTAVLLFPPAVDPRGPHLALPSLAAYLRERGEPVELIDLNVAAVRRLLRAQDIREAGLTLRRRSGGHDPTQTNGRLGLSAEHIAANIDRALATLDDPDRFFDAHAFIAARELIINALEIRSRAFHPDVSFNIDPARYDIKGLDPQSLNDLIAVTDDDRFNLFRSDWEDHLLPRLARTAPELIGISITNRQQLIPGLSLARLLKTRGYFVVIGGTVYAKFAEELGRLPAFFRHFADVVIPYEGETALLGLLQQRRGRGDLSRVPNLLYLDGDEVVATFTWVEDINHLPTPDFTGLDLDAYLAPFPVLPILTGKGCYYNRCKFCDIPFINHISRKAYRVRSAEMIAADINQLADRFSCRHFVITDEALSPRLLLKLAEALQSSRDRRFRFTGYARLESGFTAAVCARLWDMGLRKLYFGLESADQSTLEHMDKGTRVDAAPAVLRNCTTAGIRFHVFSIIGFPHETESSARRTLAFFLDHRDLIDHPGNSFDIHPFGLELRTDYYRERDSLGLAIEPQATDREFVIGIDAKHWRNPTGLSGDRVQALLNGEFGPALRSTFRDYHATVQGLWPGFEEYAVLYCDHYAARDFPYRSCLPASAEHPLRFGWNPAIVSMNHSGKSLLLRRDQFMLVPEAVHRGLGQRCVEQLDPALAQELLGGESRPERLRAYLESLIARGYLQLQLVDPHTKC